MPTTPLPNPNPALKANLSDRLLQHLNSQLQRAGHAPISRNPHTRTAPRATPKDLMLSDGLGFSCSLQLRALMQRAADHSGVSLAKFMRAALQRFMSDPYTRKLRSTVPPKRLPRNTTLALSINPKKHPHLRSSFTTYAKNKGVGVSAVLRRAGYEYALAVLDIDEHSEHRDYPGLFMDAWGDDL